jgi:hypothetical protein
MPDIETVALSDVILTADAIMELAASGWEHTPDLAKELNQFDFTLHTDHENTLSLRRLPGGQEITIRLTTDMIFHAQSLSFWAEDGERISAKSDLGQILAAFVLNELEEFKMLSWEKDIKHLTMADFSKVSTFIVGRCSSVYHTATPAEVEILLAPEELFSSLVSSMGVSGADAFYSPTMDAILMPDKKWRSPNWTLSGVCHELIHAVQRRKGWILLPQDVGLTNEEFRAIGEALDGGVSMEKVASITNVKVPLSVLKRIKFTNAQRKSYLRKYFSCDFECNAWSEQFLFLKQMCGIEPEKIRLSFNSFLSRKGIRYSRQDTERVEAMIRDPEVEIARTIEGQEALMRGEAAEIEEDLLDLEVEP